MVKPKKLCVHWNLQGEEMSRCDICHECIMCDHDCTEFKVKSCTCGDLLELKPGYTSQDTNNRYLAMRKCPVHSIVPDDETKRYENIGTGSFDALEEKENIYMRVFAVMQAVNLGKDGTQTGVKAYDNPESGWRAVSVFPTREDARAYLLDVLDTVKREQGLGVRTERNLDPTYEGGLDFRISPAYLVVARKPLEDRGWDLSPWLARHASVACYNKEKVEPETGHEHEENNENAKEKAIDAEAGI